MPIKDLTDKLEAKMPTLGQLRKGAKKTGNAPGKDLTYFRFVCHDERINTLFHKIYEDEPRIINVHLPFDTLDQNFPTWNEDHGAGGIKHRCDGEIMILWQDEKGMYHTEPKPCPYAEYPKGDPRRKCTQHGLLRIVIDELGEWGYVDAVTGGKWDCIGLTENVLEVEAMAHRASMITGKPIGIQGIPCQLKREPRMTSCPPREQGGKRVRQEKWMLYLYVHPDFNRALMEYMNRHALATVDAPQLPAPDLEVDYYVGGNGDDVERPETEVIDPEPSGTPISDSIPTKAPDLLNYVNEHVQVPYDNVAALRTELSDAGLEGDNWPAYNRDPDWWQRAFDLAFEVAESKEFTEAA